MGSQPSDWQSFWDIASPKQAAQALLQFYGAAAAQAAAHCALAAEADGRDADRRYWQAVEAELAASEDQASESTRQRS